MGAWEEEREDKRYVQSTTDMRTELKSITFAIPTVRLEVEEEGKWSLGKLVSLKKL